MSDLNLSLSFEPENPFDPMAEIARLEEESRNHNNDLHILRTDYEEVVRKAQEKYFADKAAYDARQSERIAKLKALKEQLERDKEAQIFEKTAAIVKEMVADFQDTWQAAHEYQVEDIISTVHAYLQGEKGMLNANDMGMGKTFEALVAIYIISKIFEKDMDRTPRVLWLTKSAILETRSTQNEINRWWPDLKVMSVSGSLPKNDREYRVETCWELGYFLISNYEIVRTTDAAKDLPWDIIVMDEVHKLKGGANANGPTGIWKAVSEVTPNAKFLIMLSGTPVVNKGEEMWSYLHIFDPVIFPDASKFRRDFVRYQQVAQEYQYAVDVDRLLRLALKGRMIRRSAKEVGLQLPELNKIDVILPHNEEQGNVYKQMKERFFIWLEGQEGVVTAPAIIAQLVRLRQINVLPIFEFNIKDNEGNIIERGKLDVNDSSKIDETMEIIDKAQDQVVVVCNFKEPLYEIVRRCQKADISCAIICSDTKDKMASYETDFQQGNIQVLCLISSMGEGINLQKSPDKWPGGAAIGVELDRWWNEARDNQCVARIYRQGASQPVFWYRLWVEHSIDYFVEAISAGKAVISGKIMGSNDIRPASEWKQYLKELM